MRTLESHSHWLGSPFMGATEGVWLLGLWFEWFSVPTGLD